MDRGTRRWSDAATSNAAALIAFGCACGCYATNDPTAAMPDAEPPRDGGLIADARVESDSGAEPSCDPSTAEGIATCFAELACREAISCESYRDFFGYAESSSCHPAARDRQALIDGIEAGRIVVNAAAAARCFGPVGVECPARTPWAEVALDDCAAALTGRVEIGEPCRHQTECEGFSDGTAICDLGATCPGVCARLPAEGEPCFGWLSLCASPLSCSWSGRCVDGTEGSACESQGDCWWPGFECVLDGDGLGVCEPAPGLGEPCGIVGCSGALYCIGGQCVAPRAGGASCGPESPCADGLRCESGRCARIATPGESCDGSTRVCPVALGCVEGRCRPLPLLGEHCSNDAGCAQGRCSGGSCVGSPVGEACTPRYALDDCEGYCDGLGERCESTAGQGESCSATWLDSGPCEDGLECVGGVCTRC